MRSISERDLAVVIPLVAARIRDLRNSLEAREARADELTEEEIEINCNEQEQLDAFEVTLVHLRKEYKGALEDGYVLPDYERLVSE